MRVKVAAFWVFARLCWGDFNSPLFWQKNRSRFFPPPQVMVFRQPRLSPFARN